MNKEELIKNFKPKGDLCTKDEMSLLRELDLKWCKSCSSVKNISEFGKDKHKKDGINTKCKECSRSSCKKYHKNNKDKILSRKRSDIILNPDNRKSIVRKCYLKHREDNIRYSIERTKNKLKTDPIFRMRHAARALVHRALASIGTGKEESTKKFLGYSGLDLKEHLEKLFTKGMSWDNYGKWHIDHIVPISKADTIEEAKVLSQLSNLQPLWAEDNLTKGSKLI